MRLEHSIVPEQKSGPLIRSYETIDGITTMSHRIDEELLARLGYIFTPAKPEVVAEVAEVEKPVTLEKKFNLDI